MQAISLAIGKTGIQFFAQHYLVGHLLTLLRQLAPPNITRSAPDFETRRMLGGISLGASILTTYSNIQVTINSGSLSNFSPNFDGISQGAAGAFSLVFHAGRFQVNYQWHESYTTQDYTEGFFKMKDGPEESHSNQWPFYPQVGSLTVHVGLGFSFNPTKNQWEIAVRAVTTDQPNVQPNLPGEALLLLFCSDQNIIIQAIADAIQAINFASPLNTLISGILATIPGSGDLGNNIVYDFSLGDGGILFPNNDGIQMGVKGGASYNGTAFSGSAPPALPLPTPPADSDTHHLNMYVSNYEVDALNWAFFKAGNLNAVVNADQLSDSNVLKVKTYVTSSPLLKPYATRAMQAHIQPNAAPVTAFQTVYELSSPVMAVLQQQLPTSVYQDMSGLQGNIYTSQASLETDLTADGVAASYFSIIEKAAKSMGMVVTHDINYTLVIQDFQPNQPQIVFNVKRTDILSALALGTGPKKTQTMQFQFKNATWAETFISSSIPGLNAGIFGGLWLKAGEAQYAALLQLMGKNGTPIPIMEGFQFDFTNAVLSIQENYVSILANVNYP